MRITFLSPHINISGGTRVVLKYSDLLVERGHDVRIVVPSQDFARRAYRRLRSLLLNEPRWQPTRARIRFVPSFASNHLPVADATIATAWRTAKALADAGERVGAKCYLVQAYEALYLGKKEDVDPTYRLGFRTIVVSHWLNDLLRERFDVDASTIVVPVDHNIFYPRSRRAGNDFRICMMYHDPPWKDAETAKHAVRLLRESGRAATLVMFGISGLDQMKQSADEFHFQKAQADLAAVYSSCDVFLWTSWYEGLGLPPMEAMACGCALVTTDTGGSRSYAIHGETALVAPQRDAQQLSEHLAALYDDRQLCERLAQAGRDRILGFRWPEAAGKLEEILQSEVDRKRIVKPVR